MNRSNSSGWTFLIGAIAGGAAIYYLNTPAGKRWTERMQTKAQDFGDEVKSRANEMADKARETASNVMEKTTRFTEDLKDKVSSKANQWEQKAEDTIDDFNQGVQDVKSKLKADRI